MDLFNIMGKLKAVNDRMEAVRKVLEATESVGEAGAGLVKATANGKRQVVRLQIDESVWEEDKKILEDLVISAVNAALEKAEEVHKEKLREHTQDLLPNIPGLDMSNFT